MTPGCGRYAEAAMRPFRNLPKSSEILRKSCCVAKTPQKYSPARTARRHQVKLCARTGRPTAAICPTRKRQGTASGVNDGPKLVENQRCEIGGRRGPAG